MAGESDLSYHRDKKVGDKFYEISSNTVKENRKKGARPVATNLINTL